MGTVFNEAEIKAQAAAQGVVIEKGDVVLFHTGWLSLAGADNARIMSGEPGLGLGGAKYLAGLDVVAVGSDTWGVEAVPAEDPDQAFPVHLELLAKNGIYILENMDVRALAAQTTRTHKSIPSLNTHINWILSASRYFAFRSKGVFILLIPEILFDTDSALNWNSQPTESQAQNFRVWNKSPFVPPRSDF